MKTYKSIIVAVLACALLLSPLAMAGKTKQSANDVKVTSSTSPVSNQIDPQSSDAEGPVSASGPTAGEQVDWQVMGGGGGPCAAGGYQINGTIGQPIAGWTAATDHSIHQGYWQNFMASGDCCTMPGDVNDDEFVNVGDCIFLINYLFKEGPFPSCLNEADINVDCSVDVGDIVWLINYIFKEGPPPECGCVE